MDDDERIMEELARWRGKYLPMANPEIVDRRLREAAEQIAQRRRQLAAERRRAKFRVITTEKVIHDGNS